EREYAVVFDQPQFVGRLLVAGIGEALHRPPHRFVGLAAKVTNDQRQRSGGADFAALVVGQGAHRGGFRAHSSHRTPAWLRTESCTASSCARSLARKLMLTDT